MFLGVTLDGLNILNETLVQLSMSICKLWLQWFKKKETWHLLTFFLLTLESCYFFLSNPAGPVRDGCT